MQRLHQSPNLIRMRGQSLSASDVFAGQVQLGLLGSTPLIPYYNARTLKLLAQSSAARSAALPEVPTFQEAGMQELVVDQRIGVLVPKGTSADIVARLNAGINEIASRDRNRLRRWTEQYGGPKLT